MYLLQLLLADQLTKLFANIFPFDGSIKCLYIFFLETSKNYGIAFGMPYKNLILNSLLVLIFARLWFNYRRFYVQLASGLIMIGGIGNLVDQAVYGCTIDMIGINLFGYKIIFNLADIYITIGFLIYSIGLIKYGGSDELYVREIRNRRRKDNFF